MSTNDLDRSCVPVDFVKEGSDWYAVFNPAVPRQMDVKLLNRFVHDKVICSVKLSRNAELLAVGSDGVVYLYDLLNERNATFNLASESESGEAKRNYVRGVAFTPDGKYFAAGSEDGFVRIWTTTGDFMHTLTGHTSAVYAIEFSSEGDFLISASGDRTIRLWKTNFSSENDQVSSQALEASCRVFKAADDPDKASAAFTSVAISPPYIAGGSLDKAVRIWDISAGPDGGEAMIERLKGHKDSVYSVRFVPGNTPELVTGSLDCNLKRWALKFDGETEASAGEGQGERGSICVKTLVGHKDYVLATSLVREGPNWRAASSSRDGTARIWDLKTGLTQFVIQGHKNTVTSVDLSTDGKIMATGSGDCEVRIWSYSII